MQVKWGHEIVFMYKGKISNPEILNKDAISIKEDDYEFDAVWVPIKDVIKGEKSLYPPFDYGRYL